MIINSLFAGQHFGTRVAVLLIPVFYGPPEEDYGRSFGESSSFSIDPDGSDWPEQNFTVTA